MSYYDVFFFFWSVCWFLCLMSFSICVLLDSAWPTILVLTYTQNVVLLLLVFTLKIHLICCLSVLLMFFCVCVFMCVCLTSLRNPSKWWPGTGCHPNSAPDISPRPWHHSPASAHGLSPVCHQPALHSHCQPVSGAGALLRQHWTVFPGVQRPYGPLQRLRLCGVHEEGLGLQGTVRTLGQTAGRPCTHGAVGWRQPPDLCWPPPLQVPMRGSPAARLWRHGGARTHFFRKLQTRLLPGEMWRKVTGRLYLGISPPPTWLKNN